MLTLLVPALAYSGLAMSETLFYPSPWALWAWHGHSNGRHSGVRPCSRSQPSPPSLHACKQSSSSPRSSRPLPCSPSSFGAAPSCARSFPSSRRSPSARVAWALRVVGGGSWRAVLGAYATVGAGDYDFTRWLSFLEWHVADVFLVTLGIPLLALLCLLEPSLRGGRTTSMRVFLAVALSYTVL